MCWIQTYTGRKFFPLQPRPADVDLRDIAHALSLKCRFGGHCRTFYSVAEHSVRVSRLLETRSRQLALWGLMHDAGEAYLADVGRPIKPFLHIHTPAAAPANDVITTPDAAPTPDAAKSTAAVPAFDNVRTFDAVEDEVLRAIATALGFPPIDYEAVRQADTILLATEARDLMAAPVDDWRLGVAPLPAKIVPWKPRDAEKMFLGRWKELHGVNQSSDR